MGHNQEDECPDLFEGTKFWVSLGVPSRTLFIGQVKKYGGTVVDNAADADILLVNHVRKDNPENSYSYHFVLNSIRKQKLVDLDDYRTGLSSGAGREVGSSTLPHKFKTPYTAHEDKEILSYVQDCERKGKKVLGNKIYKEFSQTHGQHTWQSWRDRYVKLSKRLKTRSVKDSDASEEESPGVRAVRNTRQRNTRGQHNDTPLSGNQATFNSRSGQSKKRPLTDSTQLSPSMRRSTKRARTDHSPSVPETPFEHSPDPKDHHPVSLTRGTVFTLTPQETEELLSYTEDILLLGRQEEDEWFQDYAERTQHSAVVCRSHFYDTIVPEYHRRQNLKNPRGTTVASDSRKDRDEANEQDEEEARRRSSSIPSLYFDVMERDKPRRSSESSNEKLTRDAEGKHQTRADDAESFRLISQEPISSGEQIYETHNETVVPNSSLRTANSKEDAPLSREDPVVVDSESDVEPTGREPSLELGGSASYEQVSSQPAPASDTQKSLSEEEEIAKIRSWLISKCEEYSTSNPAPFVDALLCTSVSLEHANTVVGYLIKGKPIPKDIAGIWTASDDRDLLSGKQKKFAKLVDKHGLKLVELRKEYLHKKSQLDSRGQELIDGL